MKKYPLRPILDIRGIREEQASRELRNRKRAVAEAGEMLARRIEDVEAFRKLLLRREEEFMGALVGESLPAGAVKELRRELESWRNRIHDLLAAVEEERRNVLKAEEDCAKARVAYLVKAKDKMKIESFSDQWRMREGKELEAREEAELEDRIPRSPSDAEKQGTGEP